MVFGFCLISKTDALLDARGDCALHGTLCLPPTWGDRTWAWRGGAWVPYKDRPAGHVWQQPVAAPKPVAPQPAITKATIKATKAPPTIAYTPPKELTCQYCKKTRMTTARSGGTPQKYCSRTCKVRAGYLREKKKAPPPPPVMLTCRACRQPFPKPKTGGRQFDCSPACHRVSVSRMRATSMIEAGIACVCGHPDRPHKGLGMCNPCCLRSRREAKRADPCRGCSRTGLWIAARGLCETCYRRVRRDAS